jgi:protein-L-isoaspartate(D-aspartate) O-methyltransferase (PCMT)
LAHRLGAENVVNSEIDPEIARRARTSLATAGHHIRVLTGDGAAGYPPGAPYDRIIVPCSVATVPWAWVEQTRPGGVIVTPGGPPMANDHLLRIKVGPDGGVGTVVGSVGFMRLRAQRWQVTDEPDDFPGIAARSGTDLDPREMLGNPSTLTAALRLGDCQKIFETDPATGKEILWFLAAGSWASLPAGPSRTPGRACVGPQVIPEMIEEQCHRGHGSESHAVAGDGIGGVMDVLGDQRDRDTHHHRHRGKAGSQACGDAARPPRSTDEDRGRDGDCGHCCGVAAGEGQVSKPQPPDEWLEDQLSDRDRSNGADDGEQYTRPAPGNGSNGSNRSDEHGGLGGVPEAGQSLGEGLIPAQVVPDQRIQTQVQVSCHVLVGVAHPGNSNHHDCQHDHEHRRNSCAVSQQGSVCLRVGGIGFRGA